VGGCEKGREHMAPVMVGSPQEKVVYPHGTGYAGVRKRVWYQIEKHTTEWKRCLPHPKPRIETNASLYKAGPYLKHGSYIFGALCLIQALLKLKASYSGTPF
jgi:hypothetical protein